MPPRLVLHLSFENESETNVCKKDGSGQDVPSAYIKFPIGLWPSRCLTELCLWSHITCKTHLYIVYYMIYSLVHAYGKT